MTMFVGVNVPSVTMIAMVIDVLVAGIMMMMMMVMVVVVIVTGVMTVTVMVVGVNVTNAMRRMVRRRAVIAVDVIARSDDVDRRSHRKGGKNESNENLELHICLEY